MGYGIVHEDWPEILDREIRLADGKPFVRGSHDCCLFAANVVLAMTGVDYADQYRGRYTTALGATRLLKKHPFIDILRKHFKLGKYGSRGDVVVVPGVVVGSNIDVLGICVGLRVAVLCEDSTMSFISSSTEGLSFWSHCNGK